MMNRCTPFAARCLLGVATLVVAGSPAQAQDAEAPRKPLMSLFDGIGVGDNMDEAGVEVFGHVEAGYTISESSPPDGLIGTRLFDIENEDFLLNQLEFTLERDIDFGRGVFDLGGRIDLLYGGDARFLHANGMFDDHGFDDGPENQFDIPQAYLDFALPYATGIRLRVGKWYTLGGYEVNDPTGNAFYSRGLIFNYCLPFTHTGVLATYVLSEGMALDFGISRGWDQALEDNNDMIDFVARLSWTPNTEKYGLYVTGYTGPQQPDEDDYWRTVLDVVYTYAYADNLTFAANVNYGYDPGFVTEPAGPFGSTDETRETAQWIAAEFWGVLAFSERLSFNARAGWLNDDVQGSRGFGCDVYTAAVGLTITPLPSGRFLHGLMFRPEVRYDHTEDRVLDAGTDHDQATFAVDAVYAF